MAEKKPGKQPYLHVRTVGGLLFELATAITGNRTALLQLRAQIDRALENPDEDFPFEEALYRDVYGEEFEVAVKLARSRGEMREPVPQPDKTPEVLPRAAKARRKE